MDAHTHTHTHTHARTHARTHAHAHTHAHTHTRTHTHSTELTLEERIEYISRAVMCAKSCNLATAVSHTGEFLHELEEKMEVCAGIVSSPLPSFLLLAILTESLGVGLGKGLVENSVYLLIKSSEPIRFLCISPASDPP